MAAPAETGTDGVARALLETSNLTVSVALVGAAARTARERHALAPVAASLLGQGLTAGVLLASLQKGDTRVNLQLECDGPLRGFFVDADAQGFVRGYVKNTLVDLEGAKGPFRWRPALGNQGFLSVLRDVGQGEFYRSSIDLEAMDLGTDLGRYFATSDQVATRVALEVLPLGAEPLGRVAGVVVQALPDGDLNALEQVGAILGPRLAEVLPAATSPRALLTALFPRPDVSFTTEYPVTWRCSCSRQRVLDALASLGRAQVQSLLDEKQGTGLTCQFCATRHQVTHEELLGLLQAMPPVGPPS